MIKNNIKNMCKLGALIIGILLLICEVGYVKAEDSQEELKENSWRYEEGEWINTEETPRLYARSIRAVLAWSKVDDYFVNDKGEKIEGAFAKGIDVSKHNGTIDWEKVKSSDVDFAIIRCGYGQNLTNQDDSKWKENADACTRLGIPFGTYIYSYAMSVADAESEAEHVIRLLKGYNLDYPVFYDLENEKNPYNQWGLDKKTLGDIAEAFCNKIQAAGYDVGIYANKNWFTNKLTDSRFSQWNKWVAQYNSYCTYSGDYAMWQCTSVGRVPGISTNVDIDFYFEGWKPVGIDTSVDAPQPMKEKITLKANVIGKTDDLQYKFVWMKDNWSKWGVIQEKSDASSTDWVPTEGGNYKIYMDVFDSTGKTETIVKDYQIQNWCNLGVATDLVSPQVKGKDICIMPQIEGDKDGLQYKYVWMKDNWSEWGIVQNFSTNDSAIWKPETAGNYKLYVDVKDDEGVQQTRITEFEIRDIGWRLDDIRINGNETKEVGKEMTIQPIISWEIPNSETDIQAYKYVWMKNNWEEWGVIHDFSSNKNVSWTPLTEGTYYVYVDVKDNNGEMRSKRVKCEVELPNWQYDGIKFSPDSIQKKGREVIISPQISGNVYGMQYKYVWMKNNWKEWGVIQDFSSDVNVSWIPQDIGEYKIYVDVKSMDGKITTKICSYSVIDKGWQYTGINLTPVGEYILGDSITIQPQIEIIGEETEKLEYKFVWMKNNWKEWGVIQDFSTDSVCEWLLNDIGEYKIYVDIRDESGNIETKIAPCFVIQGTWSYDSIEVNVTEEGKISITPIVLGNTCGLQYKYVWQKNDWKEWGVIQDFSTDSETLWETDKKGDIKIYVDILDKTGTIRTQIYKISI